MNKIYASKSYENLPEPLRERADPLEIDLYILENASHEHKEDEICIQCTLIKSLMALYRNKFGINLHMDCCKLKHDRNFDDISMHTDVLLKMTKRLEELEKIVLPIQGPLQAPK